MTLKPVLFLLPVLLSACDYNDPPVATSDPGIAACACGIRGGTPEDFRLNVGDRTFFAYDSVDLSADARRTLERQAGWLKQYGSVRVIIEGHADERGTREYNLALGDRRATAQKDYLVALGVLESRLSTVSYGKERPATLGANEAAWSQNRRAVSVPQVQ